MDKKNNIKITKAGPEDFPYIQEKIEKYWLDNTEISFDQFIVAKNEQGKTIGFIRCVDHGTFYEPATLGVDYYWRRKGIGSMLFEYIIGIMKKDKPIYVLTHLPEFFKRYNFVCVDQYPPKIEQKINTVCRLSKDKLSVLQYKK